MQSLAFNFHTHCQQKSVHRLCRRMPTPNSATGPSLCPVMNVCVRGPLCVCAHGYGQSQNVIVLHPHTHTHTPTSFWVSPHATHATFQSSSSSLAEVGSNFELQTQGEREKNGRNRGRVTHIGQCVQPQHLRRRTRRSSATVASVFPMHFKKTPTRVEN